MYVFATQLEAFPSYDGLSEGESFLCELNDCQLQLAVHRHGAFPVAGKWVSQL